MNHRGHPSKSRIYPNLSAVGFWFAGILLVQACTKELLRPNTRISAQTARTYVLHYPARSVTMVYPPCAFAHAGVSPEAYLLYRASCTPAGYGAWQEDLTSGRFAITTDTAMGWGILTVSWTDDKVPLPQPVRRFMSVPVCPTQSGELLSKWRARKTNMALELVKRLFLPASFPKSWGPYPALRVLYSLRRKLDSLVVLYIVPKGTGSELPVVTNSRDGHEWCASPWIPLASVHEHDGGDIVLPVLPEHEPSVICARRFDGLHHSEASSVCRSVLAAIGRAGRPDGGTVRGIPEGAGSTTTCRIVQGPPDLVVVKMDGVADTTFWSGVLKNVLRSFRISVNGVPEDPVWQFTHAAGPWGTGSLPVSGGAVRCIIMGSTAPSVQSDGNGVN